MSFCQACGQEIGTANFCPKCGASQSAAAAPTGAPSTDGIAENVAGLLCYVPGVGWVIALVLFLIDKRSFVKFHAVQSLALHLCLIVFYFALGIFMGMLHFIHLLFLGIFLYPLLGFACFLLLIFMMYKAYLNQRYKLPVIGDFAAGMASK